MTVKLHRKEALCPEQHLTVNHFFIWPALFSMALLSAACAGPQFQAVVVMTPPSLNEAPQFQAPPVPVVESLEAAMPISDSVKSPDVTVVNNSHIALEIRVSDGAMPLYTASGQKIITAPFVKKKGTRLLPIHTLPNAQAETQREIQQRGGKTVVTIRGAVAELLPYTPVIDSDYWVQLDIDLQPYPEAALSEPEDFARYGQQLEAYKAFLEQSIRTAEDTKAAAQADFDRAKHQFLLEGGEPTDPQIPRVRQQLDADIAKWSASAAEANRRLELIPNVTAYRDAWWQKVTVQLKGRSLAILRFTVMDLATHSIWGFGQIRAAADSQQAALQKAINTLIGWLYAKEDIPPTKATTPAEEITNGPATDAPVDETPKERRRRLRAEKKAAEKAQRGR